MEGQPAGGRGGGCHLPVSPLSAHLPGPQPPASRLLLVPVLRSVLDPQDLQLAAEKGGAGPYLAAKRLSMGFGECAEEAARLWDGAGKKQKGRSQVSAAGEQTSELREQNPRHWGVGCLAGLLRLCQNPSSPLPCMLWDNEIPVHLKNECGRSVQNAPRALCLAPLERARPCAHRPNCRQEGLKKEHSAENCVRSPNH